MLNRAKNIVVTAIVGCALVCGVAVAGSPLGSKLPSEDAASSAAVQPGDNVDELGSEGAGLVIVEEDAVPMDSGEDVGVSLTPAQEKQVAKKVVDLVNKSRKSKGKSSLKKSPKLAKSSSVRADELEVSFSHTRPNGSSWTTTFKKAGVKVSKSYCGENLAMRGVAAQDSYTESDLDEFAKIIHQNLMNSPSHKKNIMSGNYKKIGISVYSCVKSDGRVYVYLCQHFCSR